MENPEELELEKIFVINPKSGYSSYESIVVQEYGLFDPESYDLLDDKYSISLDLLYNYAEFKAQFNILRSIEVLGIQTPNAQLLKKIIIADNSISANHLIPVSWDKPIILTKLLRTIEDVVYTRVKSDPKISDPSLQAGILMFFESVLITQAFQRDFKVLSAQILSMANQYLDMKIPKYSRFNKTDTVFPEALGLALYNMCYIVETRYTLRDNIILKQYGWQQAALSPNSLN